MDVGRGNVSIGGADKCPVDQKSPYIAVHVYRYARGLLAADITLACACIRLLLLLFLAQATYEHTCRVPYAHVYVHTYKII